MHKNKFILTLILFSFFVWNFTNADMTKKQACKLDDWYYENINLQTIRKPYEEYNKTVKNSYQKKTVDVNWFVKLNGFLYYVANFQTLDMTYTLRSSLFSYNCKNHSIKQITKINMGSWNFFQASIKDVKNNEFLIFKKYEDSFGWYYAVYFKNEDIIKRIVENNLKLE